MALEAILAAKRADLAARMAARPLAALTEGLVPSDRDFEAALRCPHPAFILEVKPASPSEGRLRSHADLAPVVDAYRRHATVVSVLTDQPYFDGSFELLASVRAQIDQPVLCKDFVLGPYQVFEARRHGADAVLLMLSVLDDPTYVACAAAARSLSMGALTEVHDEAEMRRAKALGAPVIGINNRNLATLEVNLGTTAALAAGAPAGAVLIAESGVRSRADAARLEPLVDGFLVGTALMRAGDPDLAARELIFGPTKICGLTRPADAVAAAAAGATHGGLIFASESPRRITLEQARAVRAAARLEWVGVFVNEEPGAVADAAQRLDLTAVQLHGEESAEAVARVRAKLPSTVATWKAVRVRDRVPGWASTGADRVLLDGFAASGRGGTGRRFDWSQLEGLEDPDRYVLSGGLTPENAGAAARTPVAFLDVSSGVESAPGLKDPARIARFLTARRGARRGGMR